MKKFISFVAALALAGFVLAADYADNSSGGHKASLTETVTVKIPHRVALHITETSVNLDLNDLDSFLAQDGNSCHLIRKDDIRNFRSYDDFYRAIDTEHAVSNYPAAVFGEDGNIAMDNGEYLKGALVCTTGLTVQKFSNYLLGWELTADVNIPIASGIKFAIMDMVDGRWIEDGDTDVCYGLPTKWGCIGLEALSKHKRHYADQSSFGLELDDATLAQQRLGQTNGWLDDYITQHFYFDGSEVAGSHQVTVKYTLTGGW